ncbi:putative gustatory receptor clone PTE01 [Gadus morhua]|uniref:putative gustatory receptor clone PTE01 n=1 Tax=Gadus morhua TaxID=8049 RepID=UPI0011B49B0C|nr:putative gustatory receptor clone PTE01 [Gadus morhua]
MNASDPLSNWAMQLTLQSLDLPPGKEYPVFVLGTLTYMTIFLCNTLVFATIVFTKSLHKPMFLLLLNLPIMDMIGATAFLPQLVTSILTKNRSISYPGCFFQAFFLYFYGTGNFLFLTAMAYDRYVAICLPLRYMSIMNPKTLMRLIIAIWFAEILFYIVLFSLVARFRICRTHIVDFFCNNPAITKLLCDDTKFNNYFGLFFIGVIQGIPLVIVTYTYIQILLTCMMMKQADARGKALQTCGTHLVVFLFFEFNAAITLISHRFESVSPYLRRALGVSIIIFPPVLNPLIYGLKTKELQKSIIKMLKKVR